MATYTIETLKEINGSFHQQHGVLAFEVQKANEWVAFIENSRNALVPQVGDIVEFTSEYGDYYENAHIDVIEENGLYICENPYVPFVGKGKENTLSTNTSGGAWTTIPKNLQYVGKRKKMFKDWGHCGGCGNGAFYFEAEVNVWTYAEKNLEFTTKTHDRFFVSIQEKENRGDYKYIITTGGMNYTAFRTDKEYQAWLKTFHGVEVEGFSPTHKVLWTWKQFSKCIPLDQYQSITEAVVDTELCNGSIQECKRFYEGTSVMTILPHQHDRIELQGVKQYQRAYAN